MQTLSEAVSTLYRKAPENTDVRDEACDTHGTYKSRVLFYSSSVVGGIRRSTCPGCEQERIAGRQARSVDPAEERRARAQLLRAMLSYAAIPERHQENRFETYLPHTPMQQKALQVAKRYADELPVLLSKGSCLGLYGNLGVGKTHLAASIADHVIRNHRIHALFTRVPCIIREVKSSFGNKNTNEENSESGIFERYATVPLLVLDEVGASPLSDYDRGLVVDILTTRYENRLPCVYTTNFSGPMLSDYLGARAFDRLTGNDNFMVFLDGTSARTSKPPRAGGKA